MNVWLVTPAWRRYAITDLVLCQRDRLAEVLAARGIICRTIVVADDGNLEVAAAHGCVQVAMGNEFLGSRVNAGFQVARELGADYAAFIGSDDWLHKDLFDGLADGPPVLSGHHIAVVDMVSGRLRRLGWRARVGVPPWFVRSDVLDGCDWKPAGETLTRGMEGSISSRLPASFEWSFSDPHDLARVDFKTEDNMTAYSTISRAIGYGDEEQDPWTLLAERYDADLVDLARDTQKVCV